MKYIVTGLSVCGLFALAGCSSETPGPQITGPEPVPVVKFLGRDSIAAGDYRGIQIKGSTEDAFVVLEQYRQRDAVQYISAVNNYFSDVTDLKTRIPRFSELVLDEQYDTDSGVQVQLEAGKVKSIALNNRRQLTQWPEAASIRDAIRPGDSGDQLYEKLVALSKQRDYAPKFEKMVLLTRQTYAIYDPVKAAMPWNLVYKDAANRYENVQIHIRDKKVDYVIVNRFER